MGSHNNFNTYFNEGMALCHASFFAMNTNLELVLWGMNKTEAEFVFTLVYTETKRIEKMLNRFDPQSEVSIINGQKSEKIKISEEFCSILKQCLTFNTLTDYCFDVCINSKSPVEPGMRNFQLDTEKRTVQPLNASINFDFGGYAKGYALDKIRSVFLTSTVSNALVNFGNSSILAWGHHPHGNCWKINLQHSYHPQLSVYTFDLSDEILTTSGILPNHKAHIWSPITREWRTEKATYSVVTKSAVEGEAISTALVAARDVAQQKSILKNFGLKSALKVSYEHEHFHQEEIII